MRIQNISPTSTPLGFAFPKRTNASFDLQNCKQNFYKRSSVLQILSRGINHSARVIQNGALVVSAKARRKPFTIKKIIKTFYEYFKPTDVELFSEKNENEELITENLPGKLQLNLNPQQKSQYNCPTIKEALRMKLIELDIESLLLIWVKKLLSDKYYHLKKFITGVACINFFPPSSKTTNKEISEKMMLVRKQYSLLYLGYALETLFTEQPTKVIKKKYKVQEAIYSRDILILKKNDFSYHLVYERRLQFVFDNISHTVDIRMIFHIFRYEFKKNDEIFCKTCINLDSFYPVGSDNKIMFKKWEKDAEESSSFEEQQIKFNFAKELFRNRSILDMLQEIGWSEKNIKDGLRLSSLVFDEIFTGPSS